MRYVFFPCILWFISCSEKEYQGSLLIDNINVIHVESGEIDQSMDVLIDADTISIIRPSADKTKFVTESTIDGTGKFLIPGLWDMHTHLGLMESAEKFIPKILANGVLGVREMNGTESLDSLMIAIQSGPYKGLKILRPGPVIDGDPPSNENFSVITTEREARAAAQDQKKRGVDFVKTYFNIDKRVYLALADECEKLGLPIVGHLPNRVPLEEAVMAGHQTYDHFWNIIAAFSEQNGLLAIEKYREGNFTGANFFERRKYIQKTFDPTKRDSIIAILSSKQIYLCPTFTTLKGFYRYADPNYHDARIDEMEGTDYKKWWTANQGKELPQEVIEERESDIWFFKTALNHVRPFADSGIKFLAGTDFPNFYAFPGLGIHEELEIYVKEAGLSEIEALRTATIYPAEFLEITESYGTVDVGKKASLVILDKNPLEHIEHTKSINSVILNGEYFLQKELKAKKE